MTERRPDPAAIARRIIYESNTAMVPANRDWFVQRIAQAIIQERAYAAEVEFVRSFNKGSGVCPKCGLWNCEEHGKSRRSDD